MSFIDAILPPLAILCFIGLMIYLFDKQFRLFDKLGKFIKWLSKH